VDALPRALGELTRVLRDLGLTARLVNPATRPPFVRASHPSAPALSENITCGQGAGEGLWFFWSWDDPIAHVGQVQSAADSVRRVLAPGPGQ
jgi:hypothetical protein